MAPPPPKKTVTREDAPGAPEWVERLVAPINAFMSPTAAALARGLTFRENFAGEVKTVEVTPPEDWEAVTFAAGSGFLSPIGPNRQLEVRKTQDGTVKARGVFGPTGGAPVAGTLISALSAALVSDEREIFPVYTEAPSSIGSLSISSTGLRFESGNAGAIAVTGLEWMAADRRPPRWATPVDVRLGTEQTPFPGRPGAVHILDAREKGFVLNPVVITGLDWVAINMEKQKNAPGVRLHRVWGLSPGITYTLRLLILPE